MPPRFATLESIVLRSTVECCTIDLITTLSIVLRRPSRRFARVRIGDVASALSLRDATLTGEYLKRLDNALERC